MNGHVATQSQVSSVQCNLFYSSAVEGDMPAVLGAPHYSYRFAEAKFLALFDRRDMIPAKLVMPEYYNGPDAFAPGVFEAELPTLHLIFRSTEEIRLLKFALNICCFAWEFDVLKDATLVNEHPFLNQKRMLELCDEVWVPSRYTGDVLRAHGLTHSVCIPAPVPMPRRARLSREQALILLGSLSVVPLSYHFLLSPGENRKLAQAGSNTLLGWIAPWMRKPAGPTIYLSVLNPEDFRKNLDALLRGFYYFSTEHPEAVLIVKVLTSATRFHLLDVISDVIPHKLESGTVITSGNIVIFNSYLSEPQMDALYELADFYLCTSLAEGQNLPLLEAMAHGTVPVTTANTAMADYIDAENSVVIQDRCVPNDTQHLAGTIAGRPFDIHRCEMADVHAGLTRSQALSAAERAAMAAKSRATVRDHYSYEAVWPRIEERLAALCGKTDAEVARAARAAA